MHIIAITEEMFNANPLGCIAETFLIDLIMLVAISYLIDSLGRYLYWKTKKPFFRHNPMFSDEEVDAYCVAMDRLQAKRDQKKQERKNRKDGRD